MSDPTSPSATPVDSRGASIHHATHPEQELIMHLEPDQLVTETLRPVPRATLGGGAKMGLWGLRFFCVLVSLMVIYTFIDRLH